jgi:RHS repeat-associated protein
LPPSPLGHNGKGEQVRKYLGTANIYTVYDESGHWLGDYNHAGVALQQAIWLDDLPVGLIANGNQLHYIEPDHLGTPRVVIEVARNVPVWTWDLKSEAFGNSVPNQNPDLDASQLVFDMRFPGQRYDAASGLNQNGFRDGYESGTGRYSQPDPIGQKGGLSVYGYALQTPLNAIDPSGLAAFLTPIPPANQMPAGSIYCVDGVIKPYFNYDLWPKEFRECKEVSDCLMAHEMSHVADANRTSPGLCRRGPMQWMGISATPMSVTFPSDPYPGSNYSELDVSEFRAHTVELYCLMSKLRAMNGQCDEKCKAAVIRRIRQITHGSIPAIKGDTYGQ